VRPAAAAETADAAAARGAVGPQVQPPSAAPARSEASEAHAPAPVRPYLATRSVEEVAHTVVRVASRDGSTQARITLQPAELGGIEVRLRMHAHGVTAQLTADTAQGAQALQQASADLRQKLESQGISLQSLEVFVAGDGDRLAQHRQADEQHGQGGRRRPTVAAVDEEETTVDTRLLPPATGELDVLA
jgi:flagellar hook-length control protein FliK